MPSTISPLAAILVLLAATSVSWPEITSASGRIEAVLQRHFHTTIAQRSLACTADQHIRRLLP